ncbi:hypothetical protein SUGI_0883220 [Cryptomeria japonica]|nr:hypothetical protein SUGI_0883220 [Cryptomeria japonica]
MDSSKVESNFVGSNLKRKSQYNESMQVKKSSKTDIPSSSSLRYGKNLVLLEVMKNSAIEGCHEPMNGKVEIGSVSKMKSRLDGEKHYRGVRRRPWGNMQLKSEIQEEKE